jgi:hypothetical protein
VKKLIATSTILAICSFVATDVRAGNCPPVAPTVHDIGQLLTKPIVRSSMAVLPGKGELNVTVYGLNTGLYAGHGTPSIQMLAPHIYTEVSRVGPIIPSKNSMVCQYRLLGSKGQQIGVFRLQK